MAKKKRSLQNRWIKVPLQSFNNSSLGQRSNSFKGSLHAKIMAQSSKSTRKKSLIFNKSSIESLDKGLAVVEVDLEQLLMRLMLGIMLQIKCTIWNLSSNSLRETCQA